MNVLFDATWIGSHYKINAMHGGLRVIHELTKRLENSPEIDLFYSSNRYDQDIINNIRLYLEENKYDDFQLNKIANKETERFKKIYKLNCKATKFFKRKFNINFDLNLSHYNKDILTRMDIYHSPLEAIPSEIKHYKNIRRVFTSHDLMPFTRPDLAPPSFFDTLNKAYNSLDKETNIICVSEFTKSELLNYRKDINENMVDVVYLGADKNLFYQNLDELQKQKIFQKYNFKFEKYLLCLNRNQKYKNTAHIINAYINVINDSNYSDLGLVLIGTFENSEEKKVFIEKYSLYKNIHFIEYVPDSELSVFFSNALSFVYMSLYEGFGLPIIEAMQCGSPIISSNQASLPEVVGSFGICINPFDVELLSEKICLLAKDEVLQNNMKEQSLNRSSFFSWEKNLQETVGVYKKIINA